MTYTRRGQETIQIVNVRPEANGAHEVSGRICIPRERTEFGAE